MYETLLDDEIIETLDSRIFDSMLSESRGIESFRYANFSVARRKHTRKLTYPQLTIKKSRQLDALKKSYKAALNRIINSVLRNKQLPLDAINAGESIIRKYYSKAYLLGLAGGGLRISTIAVVNRQDREYIERIVSQEVEYWKKFIAQATISRIPINIRLDMYAEGLNAIYGTGRVNTLPRNTLIFWDGVNDNRTCESCRYLFAHNPYTPKNLPTLPKGGMTLCLSNCRDKLVVVQGDQFQSLIDDSNITPKSTFINGLKNILRRHRRI